MTEPEQQSAGWEEPGSKMAKRLGQLAARGDYRQLRHLAGRQNSRCRVQDTGQTPLMLAAEAGAAAADPAAWRRVKCAELLLAQGADPKATDRRNGDTAAHVAARRGNLGLLAALPFEAGKFAQNSAGSTPLMEAAAGGQWGCAKHLVHLLRDRRYRDRRKALLGARDKRGLTAAEVAEAAGHRDLAEVIRTEIRGLTFKEQHEAKLLMKLANRAPPGEFERRATRTSCDWPHAQWFHTGLSCLVRRSAASPACLETVRRLLTGDTSADPTSANAAGWTVLHAAAAAGAAQAVPLLVAAGAAVNARDQDGGTPLMEAAGAGRAETARALLVLGANWELGERGGSSALTAAGKSGCADTLALIQSYNGKSFFNQDVDSTQDDDQSEELVTDDVESSGEKLSLEVGQEDDELQQGNPDSAATPRDTATGGDQTLRYQPGDFYPVTRPQGFCLVININKYTEGSKFESRDGSERDVARIRDLFGTRLKFKVVVEQDLTVNGILNCMHEAANSPELGDHGCFVCFLMAHGTSDSVYGCDGRPLEIKYMAARFQANICGGLEHKPKIFFVQACRGSQPDVSRLAVRTDSSSVAPVKDPLFCPTESDFLFCYANTENSPAYRNPTRGSIFIQTLCDVLEREHRREHLLDIMTKVNRRVKENPVRVGANTFYHSVPEVRSQLSKKVSLDPGHAAIR